jgi:PAS domain S-box-containing protein
MTGSLRILYLEDNVLDAELVESLLTDEGFKCEVQRVITREDFVAALQRGEFDIIFADYSLPSFDGLSALKLTRELDPDVPFILISGSLGEEVAIESLKSGATDYVLKQRPERLVPAVKRALQEIKERRERRRAERELRVSEERYRRFFEEDVAGDFISTPDGKLLACNSAFARIFGFASIAEAMKSNLVELYPSAKARDAFIDLVRKERRLENYETQLRRRDGKTVYVVANVFGAFNDRSELVEVKGYLFDNTESKRLEDQLRQSQKLEAVGRLAGGVAHDFNNLLTIITNYGDLLLGTLGPNDPRRRYAAEIKKAAESASSLPRQLLAFSREQVLEPKILSLNTLVTDMEKLLQPLLSENIQLKTVLAPDLGQIKSDQGQLEQVILNLVINARDAMPDGGQLTIETANVTVESKYGSPQAFAGPSEYVVVSVTDTGVGMTDEVKAHLFEPFFSTKPRDKGTGLGLATCYGIVKASGGFINVYSEPGEGSTFKVCLPRVYEETPAAQAAPAPALRSLAKGSETVLLVEDDPAVSDAAAHILRARGYTVLEASSGAEALELVKKNSAGEIQLLFTDVMMPQMNDRELAEKLTSLYPRMKVLYTSGYTEENIVGRGLFERGAPFIQKPFEAASLIQKVQEVLGTAK